VERKQVIETWSSMRQFRLMNEEKWLSLKEPWLAERADPVKKHFRDPCKQGIVPIGDV
jgi:hypothetical protein